jgi:hypothetical protein
MCLQTEYAFPTAADDEYNAFFNSTGEKDEKTLITGVKMMKTNAKYATSITIMQRTSTMSAKVFAMCGVTGGRDRPSQGGRASVPVDARRDGVAAVIC